SSLIREFRSEYIKKAIDYLRPDNFRLMVVARNPPGGGGFDKTERWYGTEYRVERIPEDLLRRIKDTAVPGAGVGDALKKELHLPHRNEFIPTNFDVQRKEVTDKQKVPVLIKNNELSRIWYKKDDTFWVPKANVYITLRK